MSINNDISRAVLLRTHGQHTEALAILLDLEKIAPDDAALHFEIACTYDTHRLEADAIPHYEKALAAYEARYLTADWRTASAAVTPIVSNYGKKTFRLTAPANLGELR